MIAMRVSACYLLAGLDKLGPAFTSGQRMMHHMMAQLLGSGFPLLESTSWTSLFQLLAGGTVSLELALALALWNRWLRRSVAVAGIILHLGIYVTLPVSTLSATICVLYLCYLSGDDVRELVGRIR